MEAQEDYLRAKQILSDQYERLNNLYWIIDEHGQKVKFKLNWAQEEFYRQMWYLNLILKARQLGFTTFLCIFMLDCALFNSNVECAVIAHTIQDAGKIFEHKVQFPYNNLPETIKAARPADTDNANELAFCNGSSIRVATSVRSGTLQYLLISEFGKICARFPEKAKEIVTGSLNTVHSGNFVFIESTAEGRGGYFYTYCDSAQKAAQEGRSLTKMDYKFHFAPWWRHPDYTLDDCESVVIPKDLRDYFEEVEQKIDIALTSGQKTWYAKKLATQQDEMKREFPSTPEEAFEAAIQGAYYRNEMTEARLQKRITEVPFDPRLPVNTYWDLGMDDSMTIWFWQLHGQEIRAINYFEHNGEAMGFYKRKLDEIAKEHRYRYGSHYGPHDLNVRELGHEKTKTRWESAKDMGLNFQIVPRISKELDGIEAVRKILPRVWFDKEKCERGILCLDNYRKEWNEKFGVFSDRPVHDEFSHGAKAFETGALALTRKGFFDGVALAS
jgi:hypothetical protein